MAANTAPPFPPEYLHESNAKNLYIVGSIFIAWNTIVFALRLVARRYRREQPWGWDDTLIIPAYIFNIALPALCIGGAQHAHIGRHTPVLAYLYHGPAGFIPALKVIWAFGWIWYPAITFPKLSVLTLYLRIFSVGQARIAVHITIVFLILNAVANLLASLGICRPLNAYWDHSVQGTCFNYVLQYLIENVFNVLGDIAIMVIPLPTLWSLKMPWSRKLGIAAVFLAGSLGLFGSCYRLAFFVKLEDYPNGDFVFGFPEGLLWSIVEGGMCLTAACLIAMRPMLEHLLRTSNIPFLRRLAYSGPRATSSQSPYSNGPRSGNGRVALTNLGGSRAHRGAGSQYTSGDSAWTRLDDDNSGHGSVQAKGFRAARTSRTEEEEEEKSREVSEGRGIGVKREVTVAPYESV